MNYVGWQEPIVIIKVTGKAVSGIEINRKCTQRLCYNLSMRLPSKRIGWALMPGAIVLGLSGLAVAAQSGLFTGALEEEAREYAFVMWGIAGAVFITGTVIVILNYIKKNRT